ncbi:MAG TPA: DUF6265 family protein [Longimicrobiales bacterium]|nr:DUF6265 family protein [Longimicrobiales bacterium]
MCRSCPPVWALLLGLASSAPAGAQEPFTLEDVAFLSGCWAGRTGAIELREQWSEAMGGAMLGTTRFFRDGVVADWEFGRIVEDAGGVTLWPYPRGVVSERGFRLVRSGTESVFENLEHDFPVRIIYARADDGALRVRIEGADGEGQGWSVERVPCPAASPA